MPRSMSDEARGVARSAPRKPTNVTLPEPLLREAQDLRVSLSQACERGLREDAISKDVLVWTAPRHRVPDVGS